MEFIAIVLKPAVTALKDIIISGRLTPLQKYLRNQVEYKQIYRIGNNKDVLFTGAGLLHTGIGLNIDALYSAISKEGNDARRLQRTLTKDYHDDIIDTRFSKEFVNKITGYNGKELDDFILNNKPSYEFIIQSSDYEIIQYILRRMKGISLTSDNPPPLKSNNSVLKFRFEIPKAPDYNHPSEGQSIPVNHPY